MTSRLIDALLLGTVTLTLGPVACKQAPGTTAEAPAAGTEAGIRPAWMDTAVKPGDDFNAYANGGWMRTAEIPADRSSVGAHYTAFLETEKQQQELLAGINKSSPAAGSNDARIKDYYAAYMNTAAIDAAGLSPLKADLDRYAAIADKAGLVEVLGDQTESDLDLFNNNNDMATENLFGLFVTKALTSDEVVPYIFQGGLGLPDRDYYLSNDAELVKARNGYKAYIANVLTAAGMSDAQARAARIFALETKIAQAHATKAETADFTAGGTLWKRADFAAKAPGMDWNAYFTAARLPDQQTFDVYTPKSVIGLARLVGSEPLDSWKDWLAFHRINANTDVLPSKFDQMHFAFFDTALKGTPQQRTREKRALAAINDDLGNAFGKAYVDKYFPASSKAQIEDMVVHIKDAFAKRIQALDWMDAATKKEALAKLQGTVVSVGYPDHWLDYSQVTITPNNAYANRMAAIRGRTLQQLAKLGKPQDRGEWWMNPQLVNAVNLPVQNALNFPAAILQKPFFDPAADAAFNYGAIGAVIGHEISHSFDSSGAAVDSTGKLRNWWKPADLKHFEAQSQALVDQYDAYEPFPGLHLNGKLELGENGADVAGLAAAYDAYRASLNGKELPVIGGFTGDQRFFIAYAQSWATKMREAAERQQVVSNAHAPGDYRAQTVRNNDAWYDAFKVQPGAKLYLTPDKRVKLW
jgi:putative endopeptidase